MHPNSLQVRLTKTICLLIMYPRIGIQFQNKRQCCGSGSGAFLTPGSGIRIRDPDPGRTTWIIFFRAQKPFFGVTILKFFDADPGWKKIGSGMGKNRIRDEKKSDPGWKKVGSAKLAKRFWFLNNCLGNKVLRVRYLGWIHAQVDLDELERGNLFLQLQLQARVEQLGARNGIAPRVLRTRVRLRHLHQSSGPINWCSGSVKFWSRPLQQYITSRTDVLADIGVGSTP